MTLRVGVFAADDAGLESLARALVGHDAEIIARVKLDDDAAAITQQLKTWIADAGVDVVVGALDARSRTALRPLITKRLLGFSELQDIDGGRCATTVVVLVPPARDPANDAVAKVFPKIEHELTGKGAPTAAASPGVTGPAAPAATGAPRIPSIPARPSGTPGVRPPPTPPRIPKTGAAMATPAPARGRTPAVGTPTTTTIALGDTDVLGGARPKTIALEDENVLRDVSNLDKPALPAAQRSAVPVPVRTSDSKPVGAPPRPPPAGRTPAAGVPVASTHAPDSASVPAASSGVPAPTTGSAASSSTRTASAGEPASRAPHTPSSGVPTLVAISAGSSSTRTPSSGVPVEAALRTPSSGIPTHVGGPGSGAVGSGPPRPPAPTASSAVISEEPSGSAYAPGSIPLAALAADASSAATEIEATAPTSTPATPGTSPSSSPAGGTSSPTAVTPLPSAPLAHQPPTLDTGSREELARLTSSRAATEYVRSSSKSRWLILGAVVLLGGAAAAFALRSKPTPARVATQVEAPVVHDPAPVEIDAAVPTPDDDIEMEPDDVGASTKHPAQASHASHSSADHATVTTTRSSGEATTKPTSGDAKATSGDAKATSKGDAAANGDAASKGDAAAKAAPVGTVAEDGCDKVSCVVDNFSRPCCAAFKPRRADETPYQLEKPMISAGMAKAKAAVIRCGEQHATVTGIVRVSVTVAPDGHVGSATVAESPDAALGECVAAAVRKAAFGATEQGGAFTYPFKF